MGWSYGNGGLDRKGIPLGKISNGLSLTRQKDLTF